MLASESPSAHYRMGRALSTLRSSNIAIVGSGFASFHNLGVMFSGKMSTGAFRKRHTDWNKAVNDAMDESDMSKRTRLLEEWRKWPNAYEMHPRGGAEHFLPLIVAAAAGGEGSAKRFNDDFMGIKYFSYYWE